MTRAESNLDVGGISGCPKPYAHDSSNKSNNRNSSNNSTGLGLPERQSYVEL